MRARRYFSIRFSAILGCAGHTEEDRQRRWSINWVKDSSEAKFLYNIVPTINQSVLATEIQSSLGPNPCNVV